MKAQAKTAEAAKYLPIALSLATVAVVSMPGMAHAQLAGGGGQGTGVIQYFIANLFTPLLDAAVIAGGCFLWFRGWHWGHSAAIAAGGLIATNYTSIASLL